MKRRRVAIFFLVTVLLIMGLLTTGLLIGLRDDSQTEAMSATVNIPENYAEVLAGETVYVETEIKWPENDYRKDLIIEYSIKDKDGVEIAYLKTLKAVETQASFMESIAIPASTAAGTYRVDVSIMDYEDLNQDITASFKVVEEGRDVFNTYLVIIMGVVVLVAVLLTLNLIALTRLKKISISNIKRR